MGSTFCNWTLDAGYDGDSWDTDCQEKFVFIDGGPAENHIRFCCYCGRRFLTGVPAHLPFVRVCWLRYALPSYRGRILVGSDVAYVFGSIPRSRPGCHVLSGETIARNNKTKLQHTGRGKGQSEDVDYDALPHPCPRRYEHVAWLVGIYGEGSIIDPFMGTGTTLEAAKRAGFPCIGIDSEESNCELAAKRLAQGALDLFGEASA
jgi:hypothetical protein